MAVLTYAAFIGLALFCAALLPLYHIADASHIPTSDKYSRPGDFVLLGLFDEVKFDNCDGAITSGRSSAIGSVLLRGFHRIEAMVFALERVNKMTEILPNVTLGFSIYNTCGKRTVALEEALSELELFKQTAQCASPNRQNVSSDIVDVKAERHGPIIGVLGPDWSSTSIAVSRVYSVFHRPCLSYLSTSDELSDSDEFPYFLRVVPPDRYQIQAILDILDRFNWTSVSFVYTDDSYGRNALKFFKKQTDMTGRDLDCLLTGEYGVESNLEQSDYDDIVEKIVRNDHSRVVILFVHSGYAKSFLQAMNRTKDARGLQLIAGDAWGGNLDEIRDELYNACGTLKLRFVDEPVLEFEDYLLWQTPVNGNPWSDGNVTKRNRALVKGFSKESEVSRLMDSVLVYAYGLDSVLRQKCPTFDPQCVDHYKNNFNGTELLHAMKKLNFRGYNRYNVFFDSNGDETGIYDIVNIQCTKHDEKFITVNDCELVEVGNWSAMELLRINETLIAWGVDTAGEESSDDVPLSYCQGPQTYIKWSDPLAVVIVILNCTALICTVAVAICYAFNINHALIRASGPEVSYLVLAGVFVSYLLVFSLLAKPSTLSCYFIRIGYMLCFTTLNAPLLVHTNTIYRRYRAVIRCTRRPSRSASGSVKIFLSFTLILIQVTITIIFLIKTPPETIDLEPTPGERELTCNKDDVELAVSLIYNVLLILFCSIHAFLTRRVPENFSESRFIGFSAYTTLVIWIFFIPSYVITPYSSLKVIFLSAALIISATVSLIFVFIVKLYAVYYRSNLKISRHPKAAQISWPSEKRNTGNVHSISRMVASPGVSFRHPLVHNDATPPGPHGISHRSFDCHDTSSATGQPVFSHDSISATIHPPPSLTSGTDPYPSTLWL